MPYIIVDATTYNTSHANYQTYSHETFNGITMVDPLTKVRALELRAGAALSSSQIAAKYPDRPTETLVVKWKDLK